MSIGNSWGSKGACIRIINTFVFNKIQMNIGMSKRVLKNWFPFLFIFSICIENTKSPRITGITKMQLSDLDILQFDFIFIKKKPLWQTKTAEI